MSEKPYHDIPGTTLFDAEQSRLGYHLNMFCMSLMKDANRQAFRADEAAHRDTGGHAAERSHQRAGRDQESESRQQYREQARRQPDGPADQHGPAPAAVQQKIADEGRRHSGARALRRDFAPNDVSSPHAGDLPADAGGAAGG